MSERKITIDVPSLARVEGEGALHLKIEKGALQHLQFKIYEPPRFFEKFLEGRHYSEVPDIVARICGICPVAYQVSAVNALESVFEVQLTPWIKQMRRLLYCGEWIQSHSLHIHLLALPDYFEEDTVLGLAAKHPDEVKRGFAIQEAGNRLIKFLGGRSVHPVGLQVGGFHKAPSEDSATELLEYIESVLPDAMAMAEWISTIPLPDDPQTFNSVALTSVDYPLEAGRLKADNGLDISETEYEDYFKELQSPHSTALWSLMKGSLMEGSGKKESSMNGGDYLVGPLARLNLNIDQLPEFLSDLLAKVGNPFPSNNMFHSMLARAVEICFALHESAEILRQYQKPEAASVPVNVKAGTGCGWSEAPRGLLWHRYDVDEEGIIRAAKIVPPTSQNQARIEQDLMRSLQRFGLDRSDQELRLHSEKVVRNYDPCISCATHFINLTVARK
jgi:coenzyme F420-reducing hydrogenase alpha subunit